MRKLLKNPSLMIILTFASTIFIGALLLMLPVSSRHGVSFVDALFTATSAVCVTGLIVQDTGAYFTAFGQCVILGLIQVGGIGILTFSVLFIKLLTGRMGFAHRSWVEDSLGNDFSADFYGFLKRVFIFVVSVEALGAFFLFFAFIQDHSWHQSLYLSLFHSISAFCNAGFSTFSNSLEGYVSNPYINAIIMSLIVIGGLGFVVVEDVLKYFREKRRLLSFHTRIVLFTTGILIISGAFVLLIIERNEGFQKLTWGEKIWAAFFQSVTCRTAGFNTIPMQKLSAAGIFLSIMLMFIGGSPGSTAGGIKTTSFALFMLLILKQLRGRDRPEIFQRTVAKKTIRQIMTLILTYFLIVVVAVFFLLLTEKLILETAPRPFLAIVFEVVSALGTVGLSMGITSKLTMIGKLITSLVMFLGRIGPLTLAFSLASIEEKLDYEYPEEEIMIG